MSGYHLWYNFLAMKYRQDDINLLLPSFRVKVQDLLDGLRVAGYQPVLFDTLRTPAEARRNFLRGTGSLRSIHLTGAAADLICGEHGWSCDKSDCDFFHELGRQAESLGLTWGGRFTRVDKPHVQGVTYAQQSKLRALKDATARDAFVAKCLRGAA